ALKADIVKKRKIIEKLKEKCEALKDQKAQLLEQRKERQLLLHKAKMELQAVTKKFAKAKAKLTRLCVRNINKRIKRRDNKIQVLEKKLERLTQEFEAERDQLEEERKRLELQNAILEKNVKKYRYEKKKETMRANYNKKVAQEVNKSHLRSATGKRIQKLNDEVYFWQARYTEVKDELEDLVQKKIPTYEKAKYNDTVREVYMDLVANMGVSCSKVSQVVRTVLEKLAGMKVDRLPKGSICKTMVLEARHVALQHVKETISKETDVTLCTDSTTKFGHKYSTAGIFLKDRTRLNIGLREQASGSAMDLFNVVKEMVQDIVRSPGVDIDKTDHLEKEVFVKISNLFGDRANTEKKFNTILSDYRSKILPNIVERFVNYSESEKAKLSLVNELFCGLHLIDGLAHQANVTLALWEKMMFGDANVGSRCLPEVCKSDTSECGTVRLIRTVCKAVQEKGSEKYGKPVIFKTFLASKNKQDYVPLSPFRGNRINIVFHNAAGVYFLYPDLVEFTAEFQHDNSLVAEVHADLNVPQYVAGCRALGLVAKIITEPLWRVMSKKEHVLAMNDRYQTLVSKLKDWQKDGTRLVKGQVCLYDDIEIHRGAVFDSLCECSDPEFDELTVQAVELILASFVKVCCKMLADHLEHGRYDEVSPDVAEKMQSVPKTNESCERDFGVLDTLIRIKTNATGIALEGMIMYKENRTWEWLSKLDSRKKEEVLEIARRSVKEQRATFGKRIQKIKEVRVKALSERKKVKVKDSSEENEMTLKQQLTAELGRYGGLWETEEQIDEQIQLLDESSRYAAVISQLKFRRFVLGMKNEQGIFNISRAGRKLGFNELVRNLKSAVVKVEQGFPKRTCSSSAKSRLTISPSNESSPAVKKIKFTPNKGLGLAGEAQAEVTLTEMIPAKVSCPEQLLGKRVRHATVENGERTWFKGTVIAVREEQGAQTFQIVYDECQMVWWFDLWKDFQENNLELLP
uniref:Uncharacterized protein n=1 Tax=Lepisosteus oculatus TaxID=7918 RepID=W5MZG7_LEPOC